MLDRVEAGRPAEPAPDAIRRALLAGADPAHIDALLLNELGHARLTGEYRQAVIDAALAVLAAIRADHDHSIFEQLKALADKAIEHLDAVAELLVRSGDHRGAQLVAEVEPIAAELESLFELRDDFLTGGLDKMRLGHVDCSRGKDPDKLGRGATPAERFLDGLAQGNELHFATKQEAIEAAKPAFERAQQKADETAAIRRQQNAASQAFAR